MNLRLCVATIAIISFISTRPAMADPTPPPGPYGVEAREVQAYVQKTFFDPKTGYYSRGDHDPRPDYVWRQAAAFSALIGAARNDPQTYRPMMAKHFSALKNYWDSKAPVPGFEPAPTRGNGHDKYYDDNAWLVITFAEAYRLTGDKTYLIRADETARFVASGWDEQLGGGIWWHETHKDGTKNTCVNGPGAVGFMALARLEPGKDAEQWATLAKKTVDWTLAHLQAGDGLFEDRIVVATGEVKRGKLTYNSGLMLRACLGLYHQTGQRKYLEQANRIAKAADALTARETGVYRDAIRFSQFMVEADLELYRETGDAYLLERVKKNADAFYASWKQRPSGEMMANVGTARILWLLADTETEAGKAFWKAEYDRSGNVSGEKPRN